MKQYLANTVTGIRILGSILLAFVPAFSASFYALYLLCGLSDILDGAIARKTGGTSSFGARLDTVADLLFAAVSLAKLLPHLPVPGWLWGWTASIAAVKVCSAVVGLAADRMLRVARGLPAGDLRIAQRLVHLRKPRCAASDTGGECAAVRCHQTPQQFLHARLCLRKLVAIEQQAQAVSDADRLLMVSMLVQNTLRVALDALKLLVVMLRLIEKRDGADDPRFLHGNAERTSLFLKVVAVPSFPD